MSALRFLSADEITGRVISAYKSALLEEEERYQEQFAALLAEMTDSED